MKTMTAISAVFLFVVNAAWQAMVIAAAALFAGRALRPSARFVVYAFAIAGCVLIPLFTIRTPHATSELPALHGSFAIPFSIAAVVVAAEGVVVVLAAASLLLK